MNETTQQEKTTQLSSRNEQLNSAAGTKQLKYASRNETTQLVGRNETTQLCTAVDRLQRLHRLYSRIGFFYLLTCVICKQHLLKEKSEG
ncbi:hypothetical protein TNCV_5007151 [Trichonephila clavipes]|nr:hypothetical protein TNCV_5007151 [Trichonephila clavipes]